MSEDTTQESKLILNRLRRAQGQLGAVISMVAQGNAFRAVVTQLSAVCGALEQPGLSIITPAMQECVTDDGWAWNACQLCVDDCT